MRKAHQSIKARIMRLLRTKPRTAAEVAERLEVTTAYAWQYLNRYVKAGTVEKETTSDGVLYDICEPLVAQPEPSDFACAY